MTSYLLGYGIIYIGIWNHIYWNVASYLLEYVVISIGIYNHILVKYIIIFIIICQKLHQDN